MNQKKIILKAIQFYQKYLNHILPLSGNCRFIPTCSQYTYEAVNRYGIIKGLFLGIKRIVRCNPFSKAGIDNIP